MWPLVTDQARSAVGLPEIPGEPIRSAKRWISGDPPPPDTIEGQLLPKHLARPPGREPIKPGER